MLLLFVDDPGELEAGMADLAGNLAARDVRTMVLCRRSGATAATLGSTGSALPILRDRWGDVARQFGTVDRTTGDAVPGTVILDKDGKVRYLSSGVLYSAEFLEGMVYGALDMEVGDTY